jgi:phosphoglycerate kinase
MIINQRGDPATVGYEYTDGMNIADGYEAIDIGPKGIQEFVAVIQTAKTIVWNGPMGVYERTTSAHGTNEIGKAIATNADAYKLA